MNAEFYNFVKLCTKEKQKQRLPSLQGLILSGNFISYKGAKELGSALSFTKRNAAGGFGKQMVGKENKAPYTLPMNKIHDIKKAKMEIFFLDNRNMLHIRCGNYLKLKSRENEISL